MLKKNFCAFAFAMLTVFGKPQNGEPIKKIPEFEKWEFPTENLLGSMSSNAPNKSNVFWRLDKDEVLNSESILESSLSPNSSSHQNNELHFIHNTQIVTPLILFDKVGSKEVGVEKGSLIVEQDTFNAVVKTQQVIMNEKLIPNSPLNYTVYSNWYSANNEPILSVMEKIAEVSALGISLNQKTTTFNTTILNNITKHSITKIYPLPMQNDVNVEIFLKTPSEKVGLRYINVSGIRVFEQPLGQQEKGVKVYHHLMPNISSGNYIVELVVDGVVYDRKKLCVVR